MNFNRNLLSDAVRFGLAAGAVGLIGLTSAPAFAQEEDDTTSLDRIEVTGSRIKRADVEGALPVTVIDRQQIDLSGDISVAEFLRDTTFNSFGSFRPQSGSSAQALADVDLRGLGSNRTLVLVDGRRAPKAPFVGSTSDLNAIPLAAVERIEILSDGASAVYGSDAIGGVVNIITRKDFNGTEMSLGIGEPERDGGETEQGSVIFGTASDRGTLLAGASYTNRGIIYTRERPWGGALGLSTFGNNYRLEGANGLPTGAFIPVPGFACNSNGFYFTAPGQAGNVCSFNFNLAAAEEAEIRNSALFTRGQYQINDEWLTYMTANVSRVETFGRYAPNPAEVYIPENSPNDPVPGDGRGVFLRHRFAAAGNRDTTSDANAYDLLVGFQGRVGMFDLDFGARRNEYKYYEFGQSGYVVIPIAEQFIADGTYDIRDPFGAPQNVLDGIQATINRQSTWLTEEMFASAAFDLWEMGGGTAGGVVGAEYRKEDYEDNYDSLSSAGLVAGSSGNDSGGGRDVKSAYAEMLLPVLSNLEVSIAGRYDKYSDYGNDFAPKIAVRFQPLDTLTLRASYGEGFRAPSLDVLTQAPAFSADSVTDEATCLSFGGSAATCANPNTQVQVDATVIANSALQSEQSEQFSLGLAWDATDWLNLTVDYYNIEITNRIVPFTSQTLINRSLDPTLGPIPPGLAVIRDPATGGIISVIRGSANEGDLTTDGVDIAINTNFEIGDWGTIKNQLNVSYVNEYSIDGGDDLAGNYGTPEMRAGLQNQWDYGDFTLAWNLRHIDAQSDSTGAVPSTTYHDLQGTWSAPWNAKITLGVTNLEDELPPQVAFNGRVFNFNLYDAYGRVPYVRYTQSF